jgi:hypothetical protein
LYCITPTNQQSWNYVNDKFLDKEPKDRAGAVQDKAVIELAQLLKEKHEHQYFAPTFMSW